MVTRRAIIHDRVGDDLIDNAMALEQISLAFGLLVGALLGGTFISVFGLDAAFGLVAVFFVASFLVLRRVPIGALRRSSSAGGSQSLAELREGMRVVGRTPVMRSILGVTVITNLLFFAYFPIVQVIADDLGAGPFLTGLLAAATGFGMITGSLYVAQTRPRATRHRICRRNGHRHVSAHRFCGRTVVRAGVRVLVCVEPGSGFLRINAKRARADRCGTRDEG